MSVNTDMSMFEFIVDSTQDINQKKIFYYNNAITAKELFDTTAKVGGFLQSMGIKPSDSVGICLPNIPQGILAFYAINRIGAIANIIHPKIGAVSLLNNLKKTNTRIIFLFDRFVRKHYKTLTDNGITIISCALSTYATGRQKWLRLSEPTFYAPVISFKDTLKWGEATDIRVKGDDDAVYIHSGGTTGEPKTVRLSSKAFNELAINLRDTVTPKYPVKSTDNVLMALPLFHGFGLGVCMHFALMHCRTVLTPMFRPSTVIKILKRMPLQVIVGVPGMFNKLYNAKGFDSEILRGINMMFLGGDKLKPDLKNKLDEVFAKNGSKAVIMEGYGLSEVASVVTINTDNVSESQGTAINNVYLAIIDENNNTLPHGTLGEICVCSPSVMSGYLGQNTDNEVVIDGKVYIKTGDIGRMDEKGNLFFVDRAKRVIIIGGVNIYPNEVEAVAEQMAEIRQCCVVRTELKGRPCTKLIVALNKGYKLDGALINKIKKHIETNLIGYAVPKSIEKTDKLKVNGIGKVDYNYYEKEKNII